MTRILCVFALVCLAFAHKPLALDAYSGAASVEAGLSLYALPDGTLPVICHSGPQDAERGHMGGGQGCDACRIAAALHVPAPPDLAAVLARKIAAVRPAGFAVPVYPSRRLPGAGPQAPPHTA